MFTTELQHDLAEHAAPNRHVQEPTQAEHGETVITKVFLYGGFIRLL